jgi:hypothetical protein
MRGLAYFFTRSTDGHGWEAWAEDHYGARMYLGWAPTKASARAIAERDSRR